MSRAPRIALVGAGLAGLRAAEVLLDAGCTVTLLDKSRGPGGRCATRRGPAGPFDHGAPALSARGPAFQAAVDAACARGELVRAEPWAGPAWRGLGGMNAWPQAMASRLQARGLSLVTCATVTHLHGAPGGRWSLGMAEPEAQARLAAAAFDAVGVMVPAEQARALLAGPAPGIAATLVQAPSQPAFTLMAAWAEAWDRGPDGLEADACLARAHRQDRRDADGPPRAGPRGDELPLPTRWTVQATPAWSLARLEADPASLVAPLLHALATRLGADMPASAPRLAVLHRWRYAQVPQPRPEACGWEPALRLGCAGDAWHGKADPASGQVAEGLERAWCSGEALARGMLISLG